MRKLKSLSCGSHSVIVRAAAALGWHPGDDLVGVLNVASLTMHTIRGIQADALAIWRRRIIEHFVNIPRAESLTRASIFNNAPRFANIGIVNDQVGGLVFFMLRA